MKRKITGLFFIFLLYVVAFNGFCQEISFIPLTWEIVSNVRDNLKEGDYFISKSFSIKVHLRKDAKALDFDNGILVPGVEIPSPIKFTAGDKGKLDNIFDTPRGREALEIFFPDMPDKKDIRLRFVRNISKNRFELAYAVIDTNNYAFSSSDEPPFLIVQTNLYIPNKLHALPISEVGDHPPQSWHGSRTSSYSTFTGNPPTYIPQINNFQPGKYYIQIGSYTNMNTVYSEIAKINCNFPVAVMKANVIIKGKDTLVHRILIGPMNYNESQDLLRQFKNNYCDAFIRSGN